MCEAHRFVQTIYVAASAEKVWRAIVDPEMASKYYLIPLTRMELKKGGAVVYGEGDPPPIHGEIVDVEPGRKLVHTFIFSHRRDDPPSRVTYAVEAMGEMCELTLTHDRFSGKTDTYHDICKGWPTVLSGLKTLLETGKVMPWPKQVEESGGADE